jgi:hypothetical protein
VGVDVLPGGRRIEELVADPSHQNVDRAVPAAHVAAPHQPMDLAPLDHRVESFAEDQQEFELAHRQPDPRAFDQDLELGRPDLEVRDSDRG